MISNATRVCREAFAEGLRPDPIMTVSEWSDAYRILSPKSSAEPGPFRTSRTPYMREVMDCLSPQCHTREAVLMFGAQLAKTEGGNNWIGSIIDLNPGPTMAVQPTVDMGKRFSKQRIDSMIEESPRLREKVADKRARDSGNTILQKDFYGGTLVITGANSATGLRSMPVKNLFLDEIDAYPGDVDGEGDPLDLAERRTSTFEHSRKIFCTSTPTIAGRSKVEAKYFDPRATQEVYLVPCPECGFQQRIEWKAITYTNNEGMVVGEVTLKCQGCEAQIEEHHKTQMLAEGGWVAQNDKADGTVRSFHLSSLYSPLGWFSWKRAAEMWIAAQGKPDKIRTFVNTVLGEVYREKGDAPEWEKLYARRLDYKPNSIPDPDCMVLTAGVDVQKNRLEVEVVGWGPNMRSWSIDYRVFMGDTQEDEVWAELEAMLAERWEHPGEMPMQIQRMCVDAGYNTQKVYAWARSQDPARVMAIRGGPDTQRVALASPTAVDVNWRGVKRARGTMVWTLGVGLLKTELYAWLRREPGFEDDGTPKPPPHGWAEFPEYAPEYFKQMCAEEILPKIVRGFRRYEWHKNRERNEALDCRVYARAGAEVVGVSRWVDAEWDLLRESLGLVGSGRDQEQGGDVPRGDADRKGAPAPGRTPRKNTRPYAGYLDRWRSRKHN